MQFRVLGALEARRGGEQVALSRLQRVLLAALLVNRGRVVSAERLIDAIWPDSAPRTARPSLHSHVSRLRAALGFGSDATPGTEGALCTDQGGYRLEVDAGAVDADRFEDLVRQARAAGADSPPKALELLEAALALWRGPAFAEFDGAFVHAERERLEELRTSAVEEQADMLLRCARHAEAIPLLHEMVAVHPLRERPRAQLMVALYRTGRHAEALDVYQRYRATMAEELGLEPSPELQALERDVLEHSPRLGGTNPPSAEVDVVPRATPVPVVTLRPDSFVGREQAVDDVARLLGSGRLVTLVGPGGVGKTRLAEHAAHRVAGRHPDGLRVCDLAPATSDSVEQVIAASLGALRAAGISLLDAAVEALSGRAVLMVVDNCEHVLSDASRVIERLLRECPSATLLCTSRERLGVPGEQVYVVPPLSVDAQGSDGVPPPAVQLFVDRARAATGATMGGTIDPELAGDICRSLDGMPLAIELAAARTAVIHPSDLRRRLDERFQLLVGPGGRARHRTLRAVVEWSYELLTEAEERLFDRLSVFSGGFTIDAAVRVCAGAPVAPGMVAGLVAQLADRSLVLVDDTGPPTRYRMLETLRHYGREQLERRGERDAWRRRHLEWCLSFARETAAALSGSGSGPWVRAVSAEIANLRAAHQWACREGDLDSALGLCAAVERYALQQLHDEVFSWATRSLDLPGASDHVLFPAAAGVAALGAGIRGDMDESERLATVALEAAPDPDDPRRIIPLNAMADLYLYRGRLGEHLSFAAQEAELARRTGDVVHEAIAILHHVLGHAYSGDHERSFEYVDRLYELTAPFPGSSIAAWALYAHGEAMLGVDVDRAQALLVASMRAARAAEDRFVEGVALVSHTSVLARHGPEDDAWAALDRAIRHWRDRGDLTHQRVAIRLVIELLGRSGRDEPAATLLGATTGALAPPALGGEDQHRIEAIAASVRARLGDEIFDELLRRGAALTPREAVDAALAAVSASLARSADR